MTHHPQGTEHRGSGGFTLICSNPEQLRTACLGPCCARACWPSLPLASLCSTQVGQTPTHPWDPILPSPHGSLCGIRLHKQTCVCAHVRAYVHTMCVHVWTCVCTSYAGACLCMCLYCTCAHICHKFSVHVCTCLCARECTCVHMCTCLCMRFCACVSVHVCTVCMHVF